MNALPPFRLERYFAEYEFAVKYVLCASDCESVNVGDLLALEPDATERLHATRLSYTESLGAPSLRAGIAAIYDSMRAEHVLVHTGAEEAIFLFMHAVAGAGDHIVVHTPCYQSLTDVARSLGCEVTAWQARASHGWALDLDDLRHAIRPNTRAIVLNTPHNPTGYLMPRENFVEVARIAERAGAVLFSDEVYRESEYDVADRLPAACDVSTSAVSLGVMSKTYGLPGLRVGWVALRNADVLARMAQLKDYTTICNSAPSEFLAELALRHRHTLARRNLDIIQRNVGLLDAFFARHADMFEWRRPIAGPIAFPKFTRGDVEKFCHDLVMSTSVLLLPGSAYDDTDNHFRIGFGRANMPEALARVEEFVSSRVAG